MKAEPQNKNSFVRVEIEPSILDWALLRSGKSDKIKKQFPTLDQWVSGDIKPTLKQLEKYAKATSTPLGYFFLENPPNEELPIPSYRTLEDDSPYRQSPELIDTIYMMQQRQEFMKIYLKENFDENLDFINSYSGKDIKILSQKIRDLLQLEEEWASKLPTWHDALKHLIYRCEQNYITVMINGIVGNNTHRKLEVSEFRGFALVDNVAPLIFINGSDAKSAQIFTLVHELAHLITGQSGVSEVSPLNQSSYDIEKICNSASAEFLCPEERFLYCWKQYSTSYEVYDSLAHIFKVSQIVIGRRALELNAITSHEFNRFYQEYSSREYSVSTSSGGNFYATSKMRLGNLFSRAIMYQTNTKRIQYTDAYRLTGMKSNTFQKYKDYFESGGE